MNQRAFVQRRGGAWERLELLLGRVSGRGLRRLDADELFELGRLYRWVTSDLAYAQAHCFEPQLLQYLNRLTARAHAQVYGASVESGRGRIAAFFARSFPQEVRRSWPFIGACVALTILWTTVSYAIVIHHPEDAVSLSPYVPAHIVKSLHDSNFAFGPDRSAEMSSFIISNNIRVAVLAFAAGIVTLGVLTIYIVVENALMLGSLGALFARAGFGGDFWATIAPHGFIELAAIQIAGGAGLLIAAGVLLPGRLRRVESIARAGRRAGVLIVGVVAMLCVAGIIEGFFSPLRFSAGVRAGTGIVTGIFLLLYLVFAGYDGPVTTDRAA
jgi:uncharacterized membrane protein SpoIIM required for sporulation